MEENTSSKIAWRPSDSLKRASRMQAFLDQTGIADLGALNARADAEPEWFWDAMLGFLDMRFYEPYERVLDTARGAPWPQWCVGGKTNVVLNCIDRHRGTAVWDKTWIAWDGEDGVCRRLTYGEMDAEICRFAGALRARGYGKGDVIALFLPPLPVD